MTNPPKPDSIQITIDSLGARGDGVGRLPDGRRVFVAGGLPGERLAVALGEARDDGVSARIEAVLEPSPQRAEPACRHFGTCGGCALQHLNQTGYAAFKMEQVRAALARGGLNPGAIEGPFISPPGSRRRATLAAYRDHTRLAFGFNEQRSNKIVDLAECPVLSPRLVAIFPLLRETLSKILQPGQGMDISLIDSAGAVDAVMRPWVAKKSKEQLPLFMLERLSAFAEGADLARLTWQNSAGDDTDLTPVAWRKPFTVNFSGTSVTPPPGAFLQATPQGEAVLTEAVLRALPKKAKVADLYAGCGTFTFAMAAARHKVHAVEGFAPALAALKAAMPGKPVTAEKRDLAREPLSARELDAFDAVVMDPPRVGAQAQARMLARSSVRLAVSVSCSLASFVKDGAVLQDAGFRLERLTVVDQFLWSPHIELAGVFRRA